MQIFSCLIKRRQIKNYVGIFSPLIFANVLPLKSSSLNDELRRTEI